MPLEVVVYCTVLFSGRVRSLCVCVCRVYLWANFSALSPKICQARARERGSERKNENNEYVWISVHQSFLFFFLLFLSLALSLSPFISNAGIYCRSLWSEREKSEHEYDCVCLLFCMCTSAFAHGFILCIVHSRQTNIYNYWVYIISTNSYRAIEKKRVQARYGAKIPWRILAKLFSCSFPILVVGVVCVVVVAS